MTRVTDFQLSRTTLRDIFRNRQELASRSEELSSGYKASKPGDSQFSGTIAQYREALQRIDGQRTRISAATGILSFQEGTLGQANELLIKAKELATQAANETLGPEVRSQMASEAFQLRDAMVSLANSQYQGRYVFGAADDDDPPYDAATYTEPSSGSASERYVFDAESGTSTTRSVNVADNLSVRVNTAGDTVFDNAIQGLERLGRALQGVRTTLTGGVPDGGGTAYTFPTDLGEQTAEIQATIEVLNQARTDDVMPERVDIAGRLKRLETAEKVLELGKATAEEILGGLQSADIAESASALSNAQVALEASFAVSSRVLNQSILDFL